MQSTHLSRRALMAGLAVLPPILAVPRRAAAGTSARGLTHASGAIRQEVTFDARPERVYSALTLSAEFDAITRLSDAAVLLAATGAKPTAIAREPGGAFTLFGGYITGRHVEMLTNERLAQAWRAGSWKPGDYSIVRFALSGEGAKTKLILEHRGFPDGEGESLAKGWYVHYWEPMAKFLVAGPVP